MLYVIIGLIIIVCALLTIVVLAQNSKGGGLTSSFGGSSAASMIGVQRTNNLLENLTWGFGAALMVLCISSGFVMDSGVETEDVFESPNIDAAKNQFVPSQNNQLPINGAEVPDSTIVVDSAVIESTPEEVE